MMSNALTPVQETLLVEVITAAFGSRNFDATSVACEAEHNPVLAAALEAAIPRCRNRSGYFKGRFRSKTIRRVLATLAGRHFDNRPERLVVRQASDAPMSVMTRTFRFVTWDRLADYERLGWMQVADLGDFTTARSVC
jgi:hypothetical protein